MHLRIAFSLNLPVRGWKLLSTKMDQGRAHAWGRQCLQRTFISHKNTCQCYSTSHSNQGCTPQLSYTLAEPHHGLVCLKLLNPKLKLFYCFSNHTITNYLRIRMLNYFGLGVYTANLWLLVVLGFLGRCSGLQRKFQVLRSNFIPINKLFPIPKRCFRWDAVHWRF